MVEKQCTKCKLVKPVGEFVKSKQIKTGLSSWCKKCINKYHLLYSKNNTDRVSRWHKRYRVKNKGLIKLHNNLYCDRNKDKLRKIARKRHHQAREDYGQRFLDMLPTKSFIDKKSGYKYLYFTGYYRILEHIHIMHKKLGWCFTGKDGQVHHINGIRDDNREENLEFIPKYPNFTQHRMFEELHKQIKENFKLKELLKQNGIAYENNTENQ